MAGYRKQKIEEEIKRIIGDALLKEIKDPRIGFATVSSVSLNRDYTVADVGISIIGDESDKKKSMKGLISAENYIQFVIGKNMRLRNTPKVKFHLDTSIEEGVNMVAKLERLAKDEVTDDEEE
ncbi:MAG TPA: 30S ribosome-binding factor RbfA [Spirochaetota bacterium]|nr:30S ribosome-binding factor RbfA [Spirochaetota bacterium]HQO01007.1 30S ribosome-binding factor RbfA [Spirochaetota bacterium]HQP47318.1 30S ribosome-binding factor RbfA [Spirochaetota bacterium]